MTPTEARNTIVSRYLVQYNGQFPIATDNIKFTTPNPSEKWVRVHVKFTEGNQSSLGKTGNRKFLKSGILFIQIFTPINTSTDENDTLANESLNLFDGERLEQLWLYNGRIETIGSGSKEFYQQNVVVEFKFEDIR